MYDRTNVVYCQGQVSWLSMLNFVSRKYNITIINRTRVTGYQYAYRYILLSDLKTKHYMLYRSNTVTHIFGVDYWRNIEIENCAIRKLWYICFCSAMRCTSAAYVIMRCLSVIFVDHVKTNKHIFKIFQPLGSQAILVFPH